MLELAEKSLLTLAHLEKVVTEVLDGGRIPTSEDAKDFQPKLGALVAFTGGGVLRPGSVWTLSSYVAHVPHFCG